MPSNVSHQKKFRSASDGGSPAPLHGGGGVRGGRDTTDQTSVHAPVLFYVASEPHAVPTSMDELIELVRQYKVIYDTKCKEYKDAGIRTAVWEEIGEKLKQPPDKCKDDWNKIRNAYVNAMKRRKNKKSGQAAASITPWKYEEQMSFLQPYMDSRPTTTNLMMPPESPQSTHSDSQSDSRSSTPQSNFSHTQGPVGRNKTNLQDLFNLMKSSHDLRQQKLHCKQYEMDETDLFFLSMSKAVKSLPKLDQNKIKLDLHTAVSQAEIRKFQAQSEVLRTPIIVSRHVISQPHIQPSASIPITQATPLIYAEPSTSKSQEQSAATLYNFGEETISAYYNAFSDDNN